MMDGVSTMDTGNNGQMLQMNVESIAEVKVLTSGYQAEYGRSSGMQITAVTKSGTNRFRGSVYDVERNSHWNSNSWVNRMNGDPKSQNEERDWCFTGKYSGQRQTVRLTPGTMPGWNDVTHNFPFIHGLSMTANYNINHSTFLEATYGWTQNRLAGGNNGGVLMSTDRINVLGRDPAFMGTRLIRVEEDER